MGLIQGTGMVKRFEKLTALAGIDLALATDRIYGLLGPNGAGKSTLLKIIANQLFLTEGQLTINGESHTQNTELMRKVCLATHENLYFKEEKVINILKTAAYSYPNWDNEFAQELIEVFGIPLKQYYKRLSKGFKGAVSMVIGLASRAEITIFDETYVGMDAVARERFLRILLEDYTKNPRTIILSTHFIDEVATLFEELIILQAGKLYLHETMEQIERKAITITGTEEAIQRVVRASDILHSDHLGSMASVSIYKELDAQALGQLRQAGCEISHTPLQKWFVHLIEQGGVRV